MSWRVFFLSMVLLTGTACSGLVEEYLKVSRGEEESPSTPPPATPPPPIVTTLNETQASPGFNRTSGSASSIEMRAMNSSYGIQGAGHSIRLSISKQGAKPD